MIITPSALTHYWARAWLCRGHWPRSRGPGPSGWNFTWDTADSKSGKLMMEASVREKEKRTRLDPNGTKNQRGSQTRCQPAWSQRVRMARSSHGRFLAGLSTPSPGLRTHFAPCSTCRKRPDRNCCPSSGPFRGDFFKIFWSLIFSGASHERISSNDLRTVGSLFGHDKWGGLRSRKKAPRRFWPNAQLRTKLHMPKPSLV